MKNLGYPKEPTDGQKSDVRSTDWLICKTEFYKQLILFH